MRPLTVINGILLGTSLSIAVSLGLVLIVFALISGEYPRLQAEFRPLSISLAIFLGMTAISAASFYSLLIHHAWRWPAQAGVWLGVAATGWYYWP